MDKRLISLVRVVLVLCVCGCSQTAEKKEIKLIAFGSCAKQWQPQPIWNSIADQDPDLFIFLGDAIYGDWNDTNVFEVTEYTLNRDYNALASEPHFASFRENIPILATWDNHDYGKHDGGAAFPKKEMTKSKFLDFFQEPASSERRQSPGIYDTKTYGPAGQRVQIILLDTRWFKSALQTDTLNSQQRLEIGKVGKYRPNEDPAATILGDIQWQWLQEQLKAPAEIRLICTSTQVIPDQKAMDEWAVYPRERERLLDMITRSSGSTLILSGNVHFGEISRIDHMGKALYEITSSGLTHIDSVYAGAPNRFRSAGPVLDKNFGSIEIDWSDSIINLRIHAEDGKIRSSVKLPIVYSN